MPRHARLFSLEITSLKQKVIKQLGPDLKLRAFFSIG
jgi:hypothetical protein